MSLSKNKIVAQLALGVGVALLLAPISTAGDRAKRASDAVPHKAVEFQYPTAKGPACEVDVLAENFDAGIPGTWTVVDNAGTGVVWDTNTFWGDGNYTTCGANTTAAMVNSDAAGSVLYDTELISPSVDLSGFSNVSINAEINYQNVAGQDFLDIDVSTDGGTLWTNVLSWNEDHGGFFAPPGEAVNLDVTALAAGQSDVKVRFRYYENINGFDWYAQVDCFAIRGCPSDGACCLNGPGTETECAVLTQSECEANHHIFLGAGTECNADIDCQALTATIDWMSATATPEGVMVAWQTAVEVDTVGFRVLRETVSGREKRIAVVAEGIPSMSNGFEGASYTVLDDAPEASSATAYFLEDIDIFGKVTRHPAMQIDRGSRQTPRGRAAR